MVYNSFIIPSFTNQNLGIAETKKKKKNVNPDKYIS